jgi:hypothetical protein
MIIIYNRRNHLKEFGIDMEPSVISEQGEQLYRLSIKRCRGPVVHVQTYSADPRGASEDEIKEILHDLELEMHLTGED